MLNDQNTEIVSMDREIKKKIYAKPKVMDMESIGESIGKRCRSGSVPGGRCVSGSSAGKACRGGSSPASRCRSGSAASGGRCKSGNFPGS